MKTLLFLVMLVNPNTTSVKLWNDYRENPKKADVRYLNKNINVSGKVVHISSTMILYLEGGQGAVSGVTVRLANGALSKAVYVSVGESVTLSCFCVGLAFNEPMLTNCSFWGEP